jgi:uncharacterized protein YndB with AHSA1/START domain
MPDILHRVGIRAAPAAVFNALSTVDGLAGWWTSDTRGDTKIDGVIQFYFGQNHHVDMQVLESNPNERILWLVADGQAEWIGTKVRFELKQDGDITFVNFKHEGWKSPTDFMHHCSTKWATFLLSLKSLLETGAGAPFPNDLQISSK